MRTGVNLPDLEGDAIASISHLDKTGTLAIHAKVDTLQYVLAAYLVLTQNGEQKQTFSFSEETVVTIGRANENFVTLVDDRCSRLHAKLFFNEGKWCVQDLGSRNGTYVDNVNIASQLHSLWPGQHILIGRTILRFGLGSPDELDTVGITLAHISRHRELAANLSQARKENLNLREMLQANSEIVGHSLQMQEVHDFITLAAEGKTALLIRGESGTGKELIARAVHLASPRKSKPLVCLNCAAISETLLESELFGHEKGAFTGATERMLGKFESADSGTLFLDEIAEMSPNLQAKMLRVLENNTFERVGGNETIAVDVRIITATNRDLEKEVAEGRFRHDLFFRLRVLEIIVPPLRKRPSDIPILAKFFLERFCKDTGRKYIDFHPDAMQTLIHYRWPGNVRELKNVIERAVVLGSEPLIMDHNLLLSTLSTTSESQVHSVIHLESGPDGFVPCSLEEVERTHIIRMLEHTGGNKSLASKHLGIERSTLDRKIKRYGIEG
ncbi:MAG: sigma 54-interacting transcriptional regulator [Planctomycetaceae bacterium]|nr:sigma 54-interacting transcriptional regulator [Planctomycetaceae bacterium]